MEDNILNSGIEGLKELKEKLIQLDRHQNDNSGLQGDEKKLEKSIKTKEVSIEDEVKLTIKKRKDEIQATYNQEITKSTNKISKIQNKKEKSKEVQKSERVKHETADLTAENEQMNLEIKKTLKDNKIPSFVNTRLFFSLYMPKGTKEFTIILISLLIILIAIPSGVYFFVLPEQKVQYLIIIYSLTVIIFGGIYLLIGNKVKDKHLPFIKEIRVMRTNMAKNKRKIRKIKKKILSDKDDSVYSLEHYDEEIKNIKFEIEGIESRKQEAVTAFDRDTKPIIVEEIRSIYSEELLNMNIQLTTLKEKIRTNDENIKYLSRELVENYEAYLGKEFMSVENIEQLINIMTEKPLQKVSEAIVFYRKEK